MNKPKPKGRTPEEIAAYEKANDLVTGTAWVKNGRPEGGQSWEGRARMASAREAIGVELDKHDFQALARYPEPTGYAGEQPDAREAAS